MAAKEEKYYLICNYDKYDDISNYCLDRICDVKLPDEPTKPFESLPWSNGNTCYRFGKCERNGNGTVCKELYPLCGCA